MGKKKYTFCPFVSSVLRDGDKIGKHLGYTLQDILDECIGFCEAANDERALYILERSITKDCENRKGR